MQPPDTIQFSSIVFGDRARTEYRRIEELAQSIEDNGLIQPPVLVPLGPGYVMPKLEVPATSDGVPLTEERLFNAIELFGLDAGGRRCRALQHLIDTDRWDGIMHHGVTSEHHPLRVGYILKGEAFATPLQRGLTELAENLDREDMDWRDQTKLIVKTWKLALAEAHAESRDILMRDGGAMLQCGYMDLRAAVLVHDDLIANPERYKDCSSIRQALAKLSQVNAVALQNELAKRNIVEAPKIVMSDAPSVQVQDEPKPIEASPIVTIPLSQSFVCCDSLDYMDSLREPTFDHIVTDPDYGVSVERLEAGLDVQSGVHQENIDDSLTTLALFLKHAARIVKPNGFCVFWYDLDHHEKLQQIAADCGWKVQRWPLIWVKSDYRSNASPQSNFTKNVEYAMVLRKPGAVLAGPQSSSVFTCPSAGIQKRLNHPFAKPLDLSKWIYSAIAIKGQTVYDPFMGSAALSIAAAEWGLKPSGSEINPDNYGNAIVNLQTAFKKLIGGDVQFS